MSAGINDATAMLGGGVGEVSPPPSPFRAAPTPSRRPYSASGVRYRTGNSSALVPHTASESVALHQAVGENALARQKEEVSRQEHEIIRLRGALSRCEDEREGIRCKVLRLDGALQSLTVEVAEAQEAARKAQADAERQKRINMELSTTKTEVAASRETVMGQLRQANAELIRCREDTKKAEEHRDAAQRMYQNLRSHSLELEARVEELVQSRNSEVLSKRTIEEDLANAQSCLEALRVNIGADMRRLTSLFSAATHRIDPSTPFIDDDGMAPQVEELIYENSKHRATAPLYPELHDAVRSMFKSLHLFRREYRSSREQLDRMATLNEDLTASLQENSVLSQRLAKLEAQLTMSRQHSDAMGREGDDAKDGLRRVLQVVSDRLGPNDSIRVPHGRAALAYVEEGIAAVEGAAAELSSFRDSRTALQQQVVTLQNHVVEMKGEHRTELQVAAADALRDRERAVARATTDGRELARVEAAARERDAEDMFLRVSQQRDEATEAAARLRQECTKAHQDVDRAVTRADACERRMLELERSLESEREHRGAAEARLQQLSTETAFSSRSTARQDQCSPLEALVGTLQVLAGSDLDRREAVASAKAMWHMVRAAYPPRHLYRCRPTISLVLRFRVAVLAVMAANRLLRITVPRTAFSSAGGRRVRLLPSTAVRLSQQSTALWPSSAPFPTHSLDAKSFLMPSRGMGASKPTDLIDFLVDQVRVPTRRPTTYQPPLIEAVGDGLATLLRSGVGPARTSSRRVTDRSFAIRADNDASRFLARSPRSSPTKGSNYMIPEGASHPRSYRQSSQVISPIRGDSRRSSAQAPLTVHKSRGGDASRAMTTMSAATADTSRFAADVLGVIESLNRGIESSLVRHRHR